MPNGRMLTHCAHCERRLDCHPWGDPARFYCDDCFAWWDARVIWWQLGDVFLVRQAGHQDIQHIISVDHLGRLISSYLTWHDVTGYGAWASERASGVKVGDEVGNTQVALLKELPKGSRVAVVSMLGSLCPITIGHVMMFHEARKILLKHPSSKVERPRNLAHFDLCLGLITLNGDRHVSSKLAEKKQRALSYKERAHLVQLATSEDPWLYFVDRCIGRDGTVTNLKQRWPDLEFVEFHMNGADDVVKK